MLYLHIDTKASNLTFQIIDNDYVSRWGNTIGSLVTEQGHFKRLKPIFPKIGITVPLDVIPKSLYNKRVTSIMAYLQNHHPELPI